MEFNSSKGDPRGFKFCQRLPISRPGVGRKGRQIRLRTNHFLTSVGNTDATFYRYHVNLTYEDDQPVDKKVIRWKVMDKLHEAYDYDIANMNFAYDGYDSLFTFGALQNVINEFLVAVEDASSDNFRTATSRTSGRNGGLKFFKVKVSFAGRVPMRAISKVLRGQGSDNCQEALRVLDIILRQNYVKQGCLLVRQSFFRNNPTDFYELGGGIMCCQGYHSSFQPTQNGLSLNVDVSTTMIVQPGPVIDFLLSNQNISDSCGIDWSEAKRALKNLRIKTTHTNSEFRITGLSENSCHEQMFPLEQTNGNGSVEITVYDYYLQHRGIDLRESANFPCLIVGRRNRPIYIPIELCHLVSLQRYTKALTVLQRSSLIQNSRQDPSRRKLVLSDLQYSDYNSDDMLKKCGISIDSEFAQVDGRILQTPKLKAGGDQDIFVNNGRWNFNNYSLIQAFELKKWTVVNFSAACDARDLARRIIHCGNAKGMQIDREDAVIEERHEIRREAAQTRVDAMFQQISSRFPHQWPAFLLCVLPEKKTCDIYGPWKRKCLAEHGIVTQCLSPPRNMNDQYLTNVLLKINAKLGGLNSLLQTEINCSIPLVSRAPTIIFGMAVSHGSPGSDVPSVAAVVSSLGWPLVSQYRASVCTQMPEQNIIGSLFKPEGNADCGIVRELMEDFRSHVKHLPEQIIIFRAGVNEGQFTQVLNIELAHIIEACKSIKDNWSPTFTVIVAQKSHHTRFFLPRGSRDDNDVANAPAGTVVDKGVCHPRNYDFYMCPHAGINGTTRPTHYHVLHDEIGFTPDELQELVHSLSYVYQRSTSAISVVAPVYYAKLAAAQARQFVRFDDMSDTDMSDTASSASGEGAPALKLPRLHERVRSSMFFC
ncbi:hypothetical protein EJB05_32380 [Eragrostis curvula]|uniref:Piwi domain-containing protein n=1 Tax=Eragrostis curvula TaxID=38414 RepID=A0A5J9UFY9_9POAL|nr:hypothetical protein EJB05_32380 [Eragrostis curvula]